MAVLSGVTTTRRLIDLKSLHDDSHVMRDKIKEGGSTSIGHRVQGPVCSSGHREGLGYELLVPGLIGEPARKVW